MLSGALHYTAARSQTLRKAKNIQPPDSEGLLARCAISERGGGDGTQLQGQLSSSKAYCSHEGKGLSRSHSFPSPETHAGFCRVCSPSLSPLRNHGVNSTDKERSRSPGPGLPGRIQKVRMGPPPPFSSNELLICLSHVLWNNSPQSISAQH